MNLIERFEAVGVRPVKDEFGVAFLADSAAIDRATTAGLFVEQAADREGFTRALIDSGRVRAPLPIPKHGVWVTIPLA